MNVDFHCHSHFSDGLLAPDALVQKALRANLNQLALTDHDTVAGVSALQAAADGTTLQVITGIELSTRWKKHDIHVVGLNLDIHNAELLALIEQQKQSRAARAIQIGEALALCGVEKAYEKACQVAGHERVGRPHFAQVLLQEGHVRDLNEAFTRFLKRGRPAYVSTPWVGVDEAVECICGAGGTAVIAHPLKYKLTRSKLHELIALFKSAGGQGLEVVSGTMPFSQVQELLGVCQRFDLLASTGSDYHGDGISLTKLGQQRQLPLDCKPVWHQWNL